MNNSLARWAVVAMSSMTCVYLFLIWSLLPALDKRWETLVFYISGGIIQLVALPLIMVGQRLEGREMDRRAQRDHELLLEIRNMIRGLEDEEEVDRFKQAMLMMAYVDGDVPNQGFAGAVMKTMEK